MDNAIFDLYREYGMYVNKSRQMPLVEDGLKPVERRLLFSAYELCRDKFIKSATLDGHCMGHYHPHSSSYGTIVQLVKQGFLEGGGNFGSTLGTENTGAAAMRYTKVKLKKETFDIALKLIKYVNFIESEIPEFNEPEYLPSMLPLCLLGTVPTQGIGFGYKTFIPCFKKEDLLKRLMWLLKIEKKKPTIYPITDCKYLSGDDVAEELLTTGKASFDIRGCYRLDKINRKLILKYWPYGKTFQFLIKTLKEDMCYTDLSCESTGTKIEFEVDRQRNRDKIFKEFLDSFVPRLDGAIHYATYVIQGDKVVLKSIDEWLLETYGNYTKIYLSMLEDTINKLKSSLSKLHMIKVCRPYIASFISTHKSKVVMSEAASYVSKETKFPKASVMKMFSNNSIAYLLSVDTNEKTLRSKIKKIEKDILNINDVVLKQYQELIQ